MKLIVKKIERSEAPVSSKIVQLFAVVMLNYRTPTGDAAWAAMERIAGREQVQAIAFLSGYLMGGHGPKNDVQWKRLLPGARYDGGLPKVP